MDCVILEDYLKHFRAFYQTKHLFQLAEINAMVKWQCLQHTQFNIPVVAVHPSRVRGLFGSALKLDQKNNQEEANGPEEGKSSRSKQHNLNRKLRKDKTVEFIQTTFGDDSFGHWKSRIPEKSLNDACDAVLCGLFGIFHLDLQHTSQDQELRNFVAEHGLDVQKVLDKMRSQHQVITESSLEEQPVPVT
eukprot:TRINITY_DN8033_c0_g1_i1.p1 TRINITY_DN8033_c0_g1~~TRINITY_DN8033_c0_g1_i1.p1  ORF type:complete len:217 (+),score=50.14 TRINITY_DN8033_c0_g1_i1:82-651(+)